MTSARVGSAMRIAVVFLTAYAQQPGHVTPEGAIGMPWRRCGPMGCGDVDGRLVLDANWRWLHEVGGYSNCYDGGKWVKCSDPAQCAQSCALEGVSIQQYGTTYGVRPFERGVELQYSTGNNVGSRLYLMDGPRYAQFHLKNREISVDVDVSQLPCGVNGAAYLVQINPDGDLGLGDNAAGAPFGTGYGDAQCPYDLKFVSGRANLRGDVGSCAAEIDIVEANSRAMAWTLHPCSLRGPCYTKTVCRSACDRSGSDVNAYRQGKTNFYGPGLVLDSSKPFTTVTQFLTSDGTDAGPLSEVRRLYVQNGKLVGGPWSITDASAVAQAKRYGEDDHFVANGGLRGLTLDLGYVLVLSIWDDAATNMQWLDGVFPPGSSGQPGAIRGPCVQPMSTQELRQRYGSVRARFSNVAVGTINSTWKVESVNDRCVGSPQDVVR